MNPDSINPYKVIRDNKSYSIEQFLAELGFKSRKAPIRLWYQSVEVDGASIFILMSKKYENKMVTVWIPLNFQEDGTIDVEVEVDGNLSYKGFSTTVEFCTYMINLDKQR